MHSHCNTLFFPKSSPSKTFDSDEKILVVMWKGRLLEQETPNSKAFVSLVLPTKTFIKLDLDSKWLYTYKLKLYLLN